MAIEKKRKPGPVPGKRDLAPRQRTSLHLDADLVEWATNHPLGMAEIARRAIRAYMVSEQSDTKQAE